MSLMNTQSSILLDGLQQRYTRFQKKLWNDENYNEVMILLSFSVKSMSSHPQAGRMDWPHVSWETLWSKSGDNQCCKEMLGCVWRCSRQCFPECSTQYRWYNWKDPDYMPRSRQKNCEELHQDEISPKDKGTLWMKYKGTLWMVQMIVISESWLCIWSI